MRKFLIDTDTGCDDAVAILMALADENIDVVACTTVNGNVDLDQATANCLQTLETVGANVPVYRGAAVPLVRDVVHSQDNLLGEDAMGDRDLIHPTTTVAEGDAVDAIIDAARRWGSDLEIVAIGPMTNIALALEKDPDAVKQVKVIWNMGTAGFGRGNITPVAEFNVFADGEAYQKVLDSGIPMYVAGFDLCGGDAAWFAEDMQELYNSGKPAAKFAVESCAALAGWNKAVKGVAMADLSDAVAMAFALWDDVGESTPCWAHVCCSDPVAYGQVIFHDGYHLRKLEAQGIKPNCHVFTSINGKVYKERLAQLLTK